MAGARQIIDGPLFTPLPNTLWDAAQHLGTGTVGAHWQQGVTWMDRCRGGGTVYEECIAVTGTGGTPAAQIAMASNVTQQYRGATPFTVYAEFDCSPVGQEKTYTYDKAVEALDASEAYQVGKAFWTGTAGSSGAAQTTVWPHLAANSTLDDPQIIRLQTAATVVTGGLASSQDPAAVMGLLESSLASCYGGQGVIHIAPTALPSFVAWDLVGGENGEPLRSPAGHLVISSPGYTGTGPDGTTPAAPTSWVYATGAVFGFRSDVFARPFPSTFDRSENTVKHIASRTYLLGFECCLYAALVDLGVPTT